MAEEEAWRRERKEEGADPGTLGRKESTSSAFLRKASGSSLRRG